MRRRMNGRMLERKWRWNRMWLSPGLKVDEMDGCIDIKR